MKLIDCATQALDTRMKLQYLGDSRDAFKWDLLHWMCTESSPPFSELVFVPLLTPDEGSNEGRTSDLRFPCRDFVRSFLASLRNEPRTLERIPGLGMDDPEVAFRVPCLLLRDLFAMVEGAATIGQALTQLVLRTPWYFSIRTTDSKRKRSMEPNG